MTIENYILKKFSDAQLFKITLDVLAKESQECMERLASLSDDEQSEMAGHLNTLGYAWTLFNVVNQANASEVIEKIKVFQGTQDKDMRKKIIEEIVDLLG